MRVLALMFVFISNLALAFEAEQLSSYNENPSEAESGFFCQLDVNVFQERWFADEYEARDWCRGFGDFSKFCKFDYRDDRFNGRFNHSRFFSHTGRISFGRSRAIVFADYFNWFNKHNFHKRGFKHKFFFSKGCH